MAVRDNLSPPNRARILLVVGLEIGIKEVPTASVEQAKVSKSSHNARYMTRLDEEE